MSIFGEVAATLGAKDEATIILEQLRPFTHLIATSGAHAYAPIALAAGRLAWSLGRPEAVELLADAEAIARKLDAPIWLAAALAAQCELHDDRSRAEQALAIVERLGDTAIGTRARALLEHS